MDELTIGDKIYISSKRAAAITGYAKDYVGQLCREGRVEATLVGRSWYVLETSIRAHRFGSDAEAPKAVDAKPDEKLDTWESPKYEAEAAEQLPTVTRRTVNILAQEPVEPLASSPETIEDMQSAWREWFATRQASEAEVLESEQEDTTEPDQPDEIETEEVYEEEPEDELVAEEYDPVPSTPEIEETVPLHRKYEYSHAVKPTMVDDLRVPVSTAAPVVLPKLKPQRAEQGRAERKRRNGGGAAINATLISLTVFAIVITAIGLGATDAYIRKQGFEYTMLRFLAGASLLEK
jgi:hypothetical protein